MGFDRVLDVDVGLVPGMDLHAEDERPGVRAGLQSGQRAALQPRRGRPGRSFVRRWTPSTVSNGAMDDGDVAGCCRCTCGTWRGAAASTASPTTAA